MSHSPLIFEATAKNFATIVIENSTKVPVIVEFMGAWSEPCAIVEAMLSGLAKEFAERFIYAKVDIDEQPELREQFKIENVPAIVVYHKGELARVDMGQLNETEARNILREFGVFHEADELREEARQKHMAGDTTAAIVLLTQAIRVDPSNTRVALDMVQIFIDIGNIEDATNLFNRLPDTEKESTTGKSLIGQLTFLDLASKTDGLQVLQERLALDANDHKARFDMAVCLIAEHDYQQAMDQLLELIKAEPNFEDGAAREMMIAVLRMLTPAEPELAQSYQRKLNNQLN